LAVKTATLVFVDVEFELVNGYVQAGLFCDPGGDIFEHWAQEFLVKVALIAQCEVQVLRKPVGLEVALLETRSSLEDPAFRDLFMRVDTGEDPAEYIVLLDNTGQERKR
jgi:hypothetical protein